MFNSLWAYVIIIAVLYYVFLRWRRLLLCSRAKIKNLYGVILSKKRLIYLSNYYVVLLFYVYLIILYLHVLFVMHQIIALEVYLSSKMLAVAGIRLSITVSAYLHWSATILQRIANMLRYVSVLSVGDIF